MGFWLNLKRYVLVPITSLMTATINTYVAYVYVKYYVAALVETGYAPFAYVLASWEIMNAILIYWVLWNIVSGDPGFVTKAMI